MTRVIIESPYTSDTARGLIQNRIYLKHCILDSIERGEAPFAGHGFYTQFLNDRSDRDRRLGMFLSTRWLSVCSLVAAYIDLGISFGMKSGITLATRHGIDISYRQIGLFWKEETKAAQRLANG